MVEKKKNIKAYFIFGALILLLLSVVFIVNYTNSSVMVLNNSKRELLANADNTYNLAFNKNNPNATGTMPKLNGIKYGETFTLPENNFAVNQLGVNYKQIFTGWNTRADGTGRSLSDKQSVSRLTKTNNGNVVLFAQWKDANYQVSDPLTYTETLAEAVNIAKENATITYINNDVYFDNIRVVISKNLTIDIQNNYLLRNATIAINNGAKVTVKGNGMIKQVEGPKNHMFTLTNGAKLIKEGNGEWKVENGYIIHSQNSSFELYGGYVVSANNRPIFAKNIIDSVIRDTTVYTDSYTDHAIRATGTGNLKIDGNSKVANGPRRGTGDSVSPVSVISWASTGTLTLDGNATVYENGRGSCAITVSQNSKIKCLGNSSIYVNLDLERLKNEGAKAYGYTDIDDANVNVNAHCISLDSSAELTLNSTGNFFTLGNIAISFKTDSNGKSGTFTYTKGKLATRNTKNTVRRYDKYTKHNHPDTLNNGERVQERFFMMTYPDGCNYDDFDAYKNIKSHVWNVYEYSK